MRYKMICRSCGAYMYEEELAKEYQIMRTVPFLMCFHCDRHTYWNIIREEETKPATIKPIPW